MPNGPRGPLGTMFHLAGTLGLAKWLTQLHGEAHIYSELFP